MELRRCGCVMGSFLRPVGGPEAPSRRQATFGLNLAVVPPGVWTVLDTVHQQDSEQVRDAIRPHVHEILHTCWRLGDTETVQDIWRRWSMYRDEREDTSIARAAAILHGRLRSAYQNIRAIQTSTRGPPAPGRSGKDLYNRAPLTATRDACAPAADEESATASSFFRRGTPRKPWSRWVRGRSSPRWGKYPASGASVNGKRDLRSQNEDQQHIKDY